MRWRARPTRAWTGSGALATSRLASRRRFAGLKDLPARWRIRGSRGGSVGYLGSRCPAGLLVDTGWSHRLSRGFPAVRLRKGGILIRRIKAGGIAIAGSQKQDERKQKNQASHALIPATRVPARHCL